MIEKNSNTENSEVPILTMIQQIKDGQLDPQTLRKELRQQCVEMFLAEAYSPASMAQILKRSDKTIRRDIDEIRERNALEPDGDFVKRIAGELLTYARINRDHLMRLARSSGASVSEKGQCEYLASLVLTQVVTKLQSLGALPTQPKAIVGDFYHHSEDQEKSFDDLKGSVNEIEALALEAGIPSEVINQEIKVLKDKIEKKELEEKIHNLKEQVKEENTHDSPDPEANQ